MHSAELVTAIDLHLARKEDRRLQTLLARQDDQDIAYAINHLTHGKRKTFLAIPPEVQAEVAAQLSEHSKTVVFPRVPGAALARFLHFMPEDDAADIIQFLPDTRRADVLRHLKPDMRGKIEKLLTFDPETAGGLMDLNFILVQSNETILDVSEKAREHQHKQKQAPLIVVADAQGKVKGFVSYKSLLLSPPQKTVGNLVHPLPLIDQHTDQEKVLKVATREQGEVLGVTDGKGGLLGVIHLRDLLRIAQMEATEDVYKFAGVNEEEEALSSAGTAIRMRYKWLIVNLATAFMASFVVSMFEGTLAKYAILAAYMPIVAGMGGNAGTQSLAVVVRGLALNEMSIRHTRRVVLKEAMTGLANGLINGAIVAGIVFLFRGTAEIGLILAAAMVINLVVAGIAGALIPITLKALKVDPAIASTVFVTTCTDICGFFAFLGLASVLLH
jgi:magnesium transporter